MERTPQDPELDFFKRQKEQLSTAAAAKSRQSCPTLCDPLDSSSPGSPFRGILQARTLEWVAISFSNAWKWKVKGKLLSRVRLLATPWTAPHQAPPSMAFSRQEYWSGLPLPSPTVVYSVQKMNFHLMTLLLLQLFFYCLNYPIIKELRSFPTFKSQSQWCNSCSFSLPD